ncbi:hypothetical protein BLOT_007582 [Blomia tropicalis]|nr:hypothetical protein BLOT_007582 [Blomia tropicalis]
MDIFHTDSFIHRYIEQLYGRTKGIPLSNRTKILYFFYYGTIIQYSLRFWLLLWIIEKSKDYKINPIELVPWGHYDYFLTIVTYYVPIDIKNIVAATSLQISSVLGHRIIFNCIDPYIWPLLYDIVNRNHQIIQHFNPNLSFTLSYRSILLHPFSTIKPFSKNTFFSI